MSKRVFAVLLLATLAGCESSPPNLATSQVPTYGYKPLLGDLDATRPQGQTIRLVYGGQRYQATPAEVDALKVAVISGLHYERQSQWANVQEVRPGVFEESAEALKMRWQYESRMHAGSNVLDAIEGQPVPIVAISADPEKPCTIELPPPRNTGDADFFRALGEATFACMQGKWR